MYRKCHDKILSGERMDMAAPGPFRGSTQQKSKLVDDRVEGICQVYILTIPS